MARTLGVGRAIEWFPRQEHPLLPRTMAGWRLSVIPSVHEAFGVAALESSALGVPVVASDVCGLRDTVRHERTGLLVRSECAKALAESIGRLIADQELHRRMADGGMDMVRREFDWSVLIDRWIGLYDQARQRQCVMV